MSYSSNGTYTITHTAQTAIDIDQANNSVTIAGLATSIDDNISEGIRVGPNPVTMNCKYRGRHQLTVLPSWTLQGVLDVFGQHVK